MLALQLALLSTLALWLVTVCLNLRMHLILAEGALLLAPHCPQLRHPEYDNDP